MPTPSLASFLVASNRMPAASPQQSSVSVHASEEDASSFHGHLDTEQKQQQSEKQTSLHQTSHDHNTDHAQTGHRRTDKHAHVHDHIRHKDKKDQDDHAVNTAPVAALMPVTPTAGTASVHPERATDTVSAEGRNDVGMNRQNAHLVLSGSDDQQAAGLSGKANMSVGAQGGATSLTTGTVGKTAHAVTIKPALAVAKTTRHLDLETGAVALKEAIAAEMHKTPAAAGILPRLESFLVKAGASDDSVKTLVNKGKKDAISTTSDLMAVGADDHAPLNTLLTHPLAVTAVSASASVTQQMHAPAGIPQFMIHEAMTQAGWHKALSQTMLTMVHRQLVQASIQVTPPQLGPLLIQLHMNEKNQLAASFMCQNDPSRVLVNQAIPLLKGDLAQIGIQLTHTQTLDASTQQSFQQHAQQQQQSRKRQILTVHELPDLVSLASAGVWRSGVDTFV